MLLFNTTIVYHYFMFKKSWRNPYFIGIALFLFCLTVQGFWLAAFYPGAMTNDSINMWKQSMPAGTMGNLQPYLYTWILSLLRRINDSPEIIASFQIAVSAALVSGFSVFLLKKGANKWLVAGGYLAFTFSIPVMITNTIIHRDSLYASLILLLAIIFVTLFFRKDEELPLTKKVLLGLLLALIASMRYDGAIYLVFAPLLLYVFKLMSRKGVLIVLATGLLGYFMIQVPLASAIKVQNDRYLQMYNLESSFIRAIYVDSPGSFTEKDINIMTTVAPLKTWKKYDPTDDFFYWTEYKIGSFSDPRFSRQWDQMFMRQALTHPGSIIKDRYYMMLGLLRGEKINGPGIVVNDFGLRQSPLTERATRGKLGRTFSWTYNNLIARFFIWSPLYLLIQFGFLTAAIIKKKKHLIVYSLICIMSFLVIIPIVTSGQFRYMYPLFYSSFFVPALYTLKSKEEGAVS